MPYPSNGKYVSQKITKTRPARPQKKRVHLTGSGEETKKELGGGRKNDLNFTELVSSLPFTLNKGIKKTPPSWLKEKTERVREKLMEKSLPD
jgi:hypothetical protein